VTPLATPSAITVVVLAGRDIAAVAGGAVICAQALFDLAFDF
jgi:hypothetical protein